MWNQFVHWIIKFSLIFKWFFQNIFWHSFYLKYKKFYILFFLPIILCIYIYNFEHFLLASECGVPFLFFCPILKNLIFFFRLQYFIANNQINSIYFYKIFFLRLSVFFILIEILIINLKLFFILKTKIKGVSCLWDK